MMTGGLSISVYLDGEIIDKYVDNDNQVVKDFNEGKLDVLIGTSTLDEGVVAPCLPFSCLNHSVDSFTYRVRQALPEVREDFRLVA